MELFNTKELFGSLEQDEKSDIQIRKLTDGTMAVYLAELKAGKKLSAHYHKEGGEIYQILDGAGTIEIGALSGDTIQWDCSYEVKAGDVFEIAPMMVHRLSNPGANALRLIFFTAASHLGEDRIFI
ncbi:MAG: cupin domain-containing protein [Eubacteriales bacterium]|nr:cupin domain-containing protein [Eubacteriales bacterium]